MKFARRGTAALPPELGTQATDADRLARDWRAIVQQAPCDESKQDLRFASLPARTSSLDYGAMAEPITEDEVAAAIESCPKGKASGTDGMPNDWYRALSPLLAEVLAPLFSKWYAAGVLPPSFQGATIFCIPKTTKPLTGLDYRPIALLNSDYKIYARVLLNRVRMYVPDLVSPTQFGFVPDRQVHDAVDVWTAIQARVAQGTGPAETTAILLDIAKAYDTLDRRFQRLALTRHGSPMAFVSAVDSMHLATTAKESSSADVAVDVLYELVAAAPNIRGMDLGGQTRVTLVGFADDTTGYVTTAEEAHALKEVLVHFAEAAGLRVNIHKSRAVYAHQLERPPEAGELGFPHTQPAEVFRYLGAMIASSPHAGHVWDIALKQLPARLYLAAIKTTNVLQRIQVCQAIIIPKKLFVARHCWPDRDQVSRLQQFVHDYARHGVLTHASVKGRAWMSEAEASARMSAGGLCLPCVRQELLLLSARTVQHWMGADSEVGRAVGLQLLQGLLGDTEQCLRLATGRGKARQLARKATLAATGIIVLRHVLACPAENEELLYSKKIRTTAGVGSSTTQKWNDGWLHRDYSRHHVDLATLRRYQETRYGQLHIHGLLRAPLIGCFAVRDGVHVKAHHFPGIATMGQRVMDVVQIEWVSQDRLRFRYCLSQQQPQLQAAHSFRKLCDLLVFSYPAMLLRDDAACELRARPDTDTIWRVRHHGTRLHLTFDHGPGEEDLGAITTITEAQRKARRKSGTARLPFDPKMVMKHVCWKN